jgi:hypothetical protein
MNRFYRINAITGAYIEDVVTDTPTADLISALCPDGLYLPKWDGKQWTEGKTSAEIAPILAAKAVAVSADNNRKTIQEYLKTAIQTDKVYLAIVAPTAAQKEEQTEKLTRQSIRIMRLLLNQFDSVE